MRGLIEILSRLIIGIIRPIAFILVKNYRWDFLEELGDVPKWTIPFHLTREWVYAISALIFFKIFFTIVTFFAH